MFNTDKKISAVKNAQQKKDINLLPDDLIRARKKTPLLSRPQKTAKAVSPSVKELHYPSDRKTHLVKKTSSVNFMQRLSRLLGFRRKQMDSPTSPASNRKASMLSAVHNAPSMAMTSPSGQANVTGLTNEKVKKVKKESSVVRKTLQTAAKPSMANAEPKRPSVADSAVGQSAATSAQDLVKLVAKQASPTTTSSAPSSVSSDVRTSSVTETQTFHQIKEGDIASTSGNEELDVNLLPRQKRHFTPNQIILSYLMVGIIALLAMIMPYVNYYTKNNSLALQLQSLHKQVNISQDKNKELSQRAAQLRPFWLKLQAIKALLPAHIYWSHLFAVLERDTVANAYLTSLDVPGKSKISLKGEALKLRDVAEQLIVFQRDPQIGHVELTSLNKLQKETDNDAGYEFVFELQVNPSLLYAESPVNNQQ